MCPWSPWSFAKKVGGDYVWAEGHKVVEYSAARVVLYFFGSLVIGVLFLWDLRFAPQLQGQALQDVTWHLVFTLDEMTWRLVFTPLVLLAFIVWVVIRGFRHLRMAEPANKLAGLDFSIVAGCLVALNVWFAMPTLANRVKELVSSVAAYLRISIRQSNVPSRLAASPSVRHRCAVGSGVAGELVDLSGLTRSIAASRIAKSPETNRLFEWPVE
jgi:hypothetical protein